ncbi:MAG: response regulator [Lachnospiraceae bacterium]|nr:response regulator [Lachnospiraceae bacterium]
MLENILLCDYFVETAENGFKGMELILHGDKKIDCILLDLHMPIMDGFGVLELLKDSNVSDIPVIIISAESTSENLFKSFSFNAADFICKPFEPQTILERVAAALEKKKIITQYISLSQFAPPLFFQEELLPDWGID